MTRVYVECMTRVYVECMTRVYVECVTRVYVECMTRVYVECVTRVYVECMTCYVKCVTASSDTAMYAGMSCELNHVLEGCYEKYETCALE